LKIPFRLWRHHGRPPVKRTGRSAEPAEDFTLCHTPSGRE
jgi:hypothetical protein